MQIRKTLNHTFKTLGPGLLFSGAAIGVSHLVMSTQAGANFGFKILFFVILANFIKYPFFQFGPRYACATGEDLLDGYYKVGKNALFVFAVFTLATFFIFLAAVTLVSAGLAKVLFGLTMTEWRCGLMLLAACALILGLGHYHYLVRIIKVVIIVLTISTVVAFASSFYVKFQTGFGVRSDFIPPSFFTEASFAFLIALMGWMPAPIELSVWHSIWQLEKKKDNPGAGSMRGALIDFNVGYFATAIIAMMFVGLGALLMYGTGESFPSGATSFSKRLIDLYTGSLGIWVWWVIAVAAFTTMFSTTLTLLDAYARVLAKTFSLLSKNRFKNSDKNYNFWLFISIVGTSLVLYQYLDNMGKLTSFATILSFTTAPLFAGLNYMVMNDKHVPEKYRPSKPIKILSYTGIIFLTLVTLVYIFTLFNGS